MPLLKTIIVLFVERSTRCKGNMGVRERDALCVSRSNYSRSIKQLFALRSPPSAWNFLVRATRKKSCGYKERRGNTVVGPNFVFPSKILMLD